MGYLIYNGISSQDLGIVVQTTPSYESPERDYTTTHIPGKSGDVIVDKGSYKNVTRRYELASIFRQNTTFVDNVRAILDWLMSPKSYVRLEDTYEPDYYRLALFKGTNAFNNYQDQVTVLSAEFDCKPQRFLKSGEQLISVNTTNTWVELNNPTFYEALPIINASSATVITIVSGDDPAYPTNTYTITITNSGGGVIDSEIMDCYKDGSSITNDVTLSNSFPKLHPGKNWIKLTSGTLTVKPNWWTL